MARVMACFSQAWYIYGELQVHVFIMGVVWWVVVCDVCVCALFVCLVHQVSFSTRAPVQSNWPRPFSEGQRILKFTASYRKSLFIYEIGWVNSESEFTTEINCCLGWDSNPQTFDVKAKFSTTWPPSLHPTVWYSHLNFVIKSVGL